MYVLFPEIYVKASEITDSSQLSLGWRDCRIQCILSGMFKSSSTSSIFVSERPGYEEPGSKGLQILPVTRASLYNVAICVFKVHRWSMF